MPVTRRSFLSGVGALAVAGTAAGALSSCAGFSKSSAGDSGTSGSDTITFATWASDAEQAVFTTLVKKFEAANKGAKVNLRVVPYAEMFTNIDTQLEAGNAPDIFRVDYTSLGNYSSAGQLLDMSGRIDSTLQSDFIPAMLQAVKYDGKVYGVPHQTDTTCIVYQPKMLEAAGITSVPDSLSSAWSWEEWAQISAKVQGALPKGVNAFAYDWQQGGAYRWLTWLFEANGRLLAEDLKTSAINSAAGKSALEYTRAFFTNGWVPRNTSVKGATYTDTAFISQKVAMSYVGDFLLPGIDAGVKNAFEWKATYQPKNLRASSDLGGNALVATNGTKNPELAAEFLNFMVKPENMKLFCEQAVELPTLNSLVDVKLNYVTRPDLMPYFVDQATTMAPSDVEQVCVPFFGKVNTLMMNELELCFLSGQSIDTTLSHIAAGIETAAG